MIYIIEEEMEVFCQVGAGIMVAITNHIGFVAGQKDSPNSFLIAIDCTACGFIHLHPIPDSGNVYS